MSKIVKYLLPEMSECSCEKYWNKVPHTNFSLCSPKILEFSIEMCLNVDLINVTFHNFFFRLFMYFIGWQNKQLVKKLLQNEGNWCFLGFIWKGSVWKTAEMQIWNSSVTNIGPLLNVWTKISPKSSKNLENMQHYGRDWHLKSLKSNLDLIK